MATLAMVGGAFLTMVGLFHVIVGLEMLLITARVRTAYLRMGAWTDAEFHRSGVTMLVIGAVALLCLWGLS
jgi:hypothetical protein